MGRLVCKDGPESGEPVDDGNDSHTRPEGKEQQRQTVGSRTHAAIIAPSSTRN